MSFSTLKISDVDIAWYHNTKLSFAMLSWDGHAQQWVGSHHHYIYFMENSVLQNYDHKSNKKCYNLFHRFMTSLLSLTLYSMKECWKIISLTNFYIYIFWCFVTEYWFLRNLLDWELLSRPLHYLSIYSSIFIYLPVSRYLL